MAEPSDAMSLVTAQLVLMADFVGKRITEEQYKERAFAMLATALAAAERRGAEAYAADLANAVGCPPGVNLLAYLNMAVRSAAKAPIGTKAELDALRAVAEAARTFVDLFVSAPDSRETKAARDLLLGLTVQMRTALDALDKAREAGR